MKTKKQGITDELRKKIRKQVKKGQTKRQVAIQNNVTERTVYYHTRDIKLYCLKKLRIQDKKLELMKDLLKGGYGFSCSKYSSKEYYELKKFFPTIQKTKIYNRVIFYLEDKKNYATKSFIKKTQRKIISYHEIKNITRVFNSKLNIKEKKDLIDINHSKKHHSNKKKPSKDSLAFFYIRIYCSEIEDNSLEMVGAISTLLKSLLIVSVEIISLHPADTSFFTASPANNP